MALVNTPPNNTTNPPPEDRHVVIEPPPPVQPRLKQYVPLQNFVIDSKTHAKALTLIMLTPNVALPFLSSNMLIPLDVAIRQGIYPPKKESPPEKTVEKIKKVVEEAMGIEETSPSTDPKSILDNSLRDQVIAKKHQTAKIDPAKLAAIKAGGKPKTSA
jgi:hypothetical protein